MTLTPTPYDLISIRDWNVRQSSKRQAVFPENSPNDVRTLAGGSSILCRVVSRSSRQLHYQPDEEVAMLARASYQTRTRVIDDHALGFYPVRSGNRIPAFLQNFNPRPRRVARIIRGYIDQSMLAPTESRTILPVEGCERLESGSTIRQPPR